MPRISVVSDQSMQIEKELHGGVMFDPEKVERWDSDGSPMVPSSESPNFANGRFVLFTVYDELLVRFQKLDAAARLALNDCCDLISTDAGHALQDALGLERS